MRPGIVAMAEELERNDMVRLMTMKGELVALATMLTRSEMVADMNEGEIARPDSVFLPTEAYPRAWKKNDSSS